MRREASATGAVMDFRDLAGGKAQTATIDRIMLRFRPIAPRPEDAERGGSSSGDWKTIGAGKKGMAVASKFGTGRRKRKDDTRVRIKNNLTREIRASKNININININIGKGNESSGGNNPEKELVEGRLSSLPEVKKGDGDRTEKFVDENGSGLVVETWLTVERLIVTEGMISARLGLGSLVDDTCPVFVTDDQVKVVEWVNEAFKRMVVGVGPAEVRVGLGVKEGLQLPSMGSTTTSFTCWVRVECGSYTWRKERRWSRTVPCDVWRMMDCGGGLTWRMDVKAALGLAL